MNLKVWPIALGAGMAAGAVAVLMMPYNNPTRKLASKTAHKMESAMTDAAEMMANKLSN